LFVFVLEFNNYFEIIIQFEVGFKERNRKSANHIFYLMIDLPGDKTGRVSPLFAGRASDS
jgi:hypothetical protein